MKKQIIGIGILVMLATVSLCGCQLGNPDNEENKEYSAELGASFRINDFEFTFTNCEVKDEYCFGHDKSKLYLSISAKNEYGQRYSKFYIMAVEVEVEGGYFYTGYDVLGWASGAEPLKTTTHDFTFCIPDGAIPIRAYFNYAEEVIYEDTFPIMVDLSNKIYYYTPIGEISSNIDDHLGKTVHIKAKLSNCFHAVTFNIRGGTLTDENGDELYMIFQEGVDLWILDIENTMVMYNNYFIWTGTIDNEWNIQIGDSLRLDVSEYEKA